MDLQRIFTEHPASVGETYWGHLLRASWFGGKMLLAAGACFVHAIFPFLFVKTGSQAITQLHAAMVTNRRAAEPREVDLVPGLRSHSGG
ncbi:MAG TPA: DUF6356 family protein [Steroidobacteraceae bacterium]|nr:DUF6356 family protein [Steroidobacteraceae bacterium]